jgi:protein SCO1/2
MNSKILIYLFIIIYVCLSDVKYYAQSDRIEAGIDEKLGAYLPLDLSFINSQGDSVLLKDLVNKPILLALVYYECPGICNPLLTELAWVANKVDLVPKEDFEIIALSFDHEETPEIAAKWKHSYFEGMKGDYPEDAWTFLTGDSVSIKTTVFQLKLLRMLLDFILGPTMRNLFTQVLFYLFHLKERFVDICLG